mgnify:CR=1 FL=1
MAERQLATSLCGIRNDHLARYLWAAERLGDRGRVIDAACGCGYGSSILADRGFTVTAFDIAPDAIEYARSHWDRPGIDWLICDLSSPEFASSDAVVSFETIEHLADPCQFLAAARTSAPRLIASVPNQDVIPFVRKRFPFHHRHYTTDEFAALLGECGWAVTEWFGQKDKFSDVHQGLNGRTIVVDAARVE